MLVRMRLVLLATWLVSCPLQSLAQQYQSTAQWIDLGTESGFEWTVTNETGEVYPASVPGNIYTDLMAAGVLGDPYYGWNNLDYLWVANTTWTYQLTFQLDYSVMNKSVIQLIMYGIDTNATIFLNDKPLFTNDNMFHRNRVAIQSWLLDGDNSLTVRFEPKPIWALEEAHSCDASSSDAQCPTQCDYGQLCDVNFCRIAPYEFGWDWGPSFSPIGLWRAVKLHAFDGAVLRDAIVTRMTPNPDPWYPTDTSITLRFFIDTGITDVLLPSPELSHTLETTLSSSSSSLYDILIVMKDYTNMIWDIQVPGSSFGSGMELNYSFTFDYIGDQWWPNGFGNQELQRFNLSLICDYNLYYDPGFEIKIGLRTAQLIQESLNNDNNDNDDNGRSFKFNLNGIDIPVKGSNMIPFDSFYSPSRINRTMMKYYFESLKWSGQNMIRVWGGGMYASDDFYDLSDEYGLMIWQDSMFACAQYWTRPLFLKSVAKEIMDNAKRLMIHPSIILWAGNNENTCHIDNDNDNAQPYRVLYFDTILNNLSDIMSNQVSTFDRPLYGSLEWLVTSPSNGDENRVDPCCGDDCKNVNYGDSHVYLYDQDCWDVSIYPIPRFVSEFGWQSWPSFMTMKDYVESSDWYWDSPQMQNRQKHENGQNQMMDLISMHFNAPPDTGDLIEDYRYMLYLSQVYQSYCYKTEVELLRSMRGIHDTMGVLYWQTNDVWVGASWSLIDWTGRYKVGQYAMKHFYGAQMVSGQWNGTDDSFLFYGINDDTQLDVMNGYIEFYSHNIDDQMSGAYLNSWHINQVTIKRESSLLIQRYNLSEMTDLTRCSSSSSSSKHRSDNVGDWMENTCCILEWALYDGNGSFISDNWMFLSSPKNVPLSRVPNPKLMITDVIDFSEDHSEYSIVFEAEYMALYVWIECVSHLGVFSDNGLLINAGSHSVRFYLKSIAGVKSVPGLTVNDFTIYSLYDARGFGAG